MANLNGTTTNLRTAFLGVYSVLKSELLNGPAFERTDDSRQCVERLPEVACALLMAGEDLDNHASVKDVLVDMGIYFQVEDDYLDHFGEPEKIGKIGTEIADFKCFWLVVKALELCNEEQKKIL